MRLTPPTSSDNARAAWLRLVASSALARFANRGTCRAVDLVEGVLTVEVVDDRHRERLAGLMVFGGPVERVVFVAPASERAA